METLHIVTLAFTVLGFLFIYVFVFAKDKKGDILPVIPIIKRPYIEPNTPDEIKEIMEYLYERHVGKTWNDYSNLIAFNYIRAIMVLGTHLSWNFPNKGNEIRISYPDGIYIISLYIIHESPIMLGDRHNTVLRKVAYRKFDKPNSPYPKIKRGNKDLDNDYYLTQWLPVSDNKIRDKVETINPEY